MSYESPPRERDIKSMAPPLMLAIILVTGFVLTVALAFALWGGDEGNQAGPGQGGGDTQVEEVAPATP